MSSRPRSGSLAGWRFGNYIATEIIGQGGMGSVYLAEHPEIGRKVAIKVLGREHNEEMVQRFTDEARAVSRIGHPNIIDIYDFGRTETGRLYYVMEWLDGRELRAVMNERAPMPAADVRPYVEQICAAIHAAHEHSIVHRDLKPANIFVLNREPTKIKVLDFGVAKLIAADAAASGRTSPGIVIGTPMFSAPEQASAEMHRICPQTDLYALGVILYWMLAGRPPFLAENNSVLLAMHICDKPPPLREVAPSVPEGVAVVVDQCLAKDPRQRPRSARDLAAAFVSVLQEERDEMRALDDGKSGIMVFVPATPILEVATKATSVERPPPIRPLTLAPEAAISPLSTAELADVITEVEADGPPPANRAPAQRPDEPSEEVVTIPPNLIFNAVTASDVLARRPLDPAFAPRSIDQPSEEVITIPPGILPVRRHPTPRPAAPSEEVVTFRPTSPSEEVATIPPPGATTPPPDEPGEAPSSQPPPRATQHSPSSPLVPPARRTTQPIVSPPARRSTSWLPWVLVAISVAVAVAIALLK
jgi:serine/threonine protein kinase